MEGITTKRQLDLLIEDIYKDAVCKYRNDPENFERIHIDYDKLRLILFANFSFNGLQFFSTVNKEALKLFPFIDLSEVNWYGVRIEKIDFSDTNVDLSKLDFQSVNSKSIKYCNFEGMNLSNQDFTGVNVIGANLTDCALSSSINGAIGKDFAIYDDSKEEYLYARKDKDGKTRILKL